MEEVSEQELRVERVAALDLGKAGLEACVRVPHETRPGHRMQELRGYATTTSELLELADWLRCWGVTRVVMGVNQQLLEGCLRPTGSRRVRMLAGQRPRREKRTGAALVRLR